MVRILQYIFPEILYYKHLNEKNRDRWVRDQLKQIIPGKKILDAGAGEMRYRRYAEHLDYVSQDFCQYDGNGDGHGLQMRNWNQAGIDIISDIIAIPVESESFDVILCTEVLEHVSDPIQVLKEFHRVLKKKGKLILTAPFCSLTHFAPFHYYSGFNRYFYEYHLKIIDYLIVEITPNGNYYDFLGQEIIRLNSLLNKKFNFLTKFLFLLFLKILYRESKKGNSNKDLLCYGFHVLAEKN